jgi:predicted  nucleic acid-binding Zn-ribbon protein
VLGPAAVLALAAAPTAAQTIDELNTRIASAQSEAQTIGAQLDATTSELASAREQAVAAAGREAELSAVLAEGQQRAAELEARVAETQAQLAEARERLDRALAALRERLVAIYKGDAPDATTLLLDARGFDDLATRTELLDRIEAADAALVTRVRDLRDEVAALLDEVSEARDAQLAYNARVAAARDQIAAVRARAESAAAALDQARAEQVAAIDSLQSQVATWQSQVQEAQQVSAYEAQQEVGSWFGDWAIPQAIVMCESGGDWGAVNPSSGAGGAYQIMPSTWSSYGGSGSPEDASPEEQGRIAAQIWADSGSAAWACAQ